MVKVFSDISEVLTLKGAAAKGGRSVCEADLSIVKKALIVTSAGKIVWVGKKSQFSRSVIKKLGIDIRKVKEVSLNNSLVMPSFVECHTHSVFAGDRQDEFEKRNLGASYQEIAKSGGGIISTVTSTRKASSALLTELLMKRVKRFKEQGVAALEVKSGYGLDLKTELKILKLLSSVKGMNIFSTYLGPHAVPKEFSSASDYMDFIITKVLPRLSKEKLLKRADIFIEKGYFDKSLANKYYEALSSYDVDLTGHVDQLTCSRSVSDFCGNKKLKSLDHLVEVDSKGIRALSNSDVTAVLLPAADFYLKMNYPPARKLIDSGARVAIATDFNPGSSPTQDLSFVGVLSRLEMKMTLPEVIVAYTLGASYALGIESKMGSIEVGKSANFICLNDSFDRLFYEVGYHPVIKSNYNKL